MEWTVFCFRVTMRGAVQVSIVILLVTVSDGAVITGVSCLTGPHALGFGRMSGSAWERARD